MPQDLDDEDEDRPLMQDREDDAVSPQRPPRQRASDASVMSGSKARFRDDPSPPRNTRDGSPSRRFDGEARSMPGETIDDRFLKSRAYAQSRAEWKKRTRDDFKRRNDLRQTRKGDEQEERRGRVGCYSTATSYRMEELFQALMMTKRAQFIREVIHVALYDNGGDIFYFSYGVVVMWGLRRTEERRILAELKSYKIEEESLGPDDIADDDFRYSYHKDFSRPLEDWSRAPSKSTEHLTEWARIVSDEIILPDCRTDEAGIIMGPGRWGNRTQDLLYKISFSYALATSVKLDHFEEGTRQLIAATKPLPAEMARHGKIRMSRLDMSRLIGRLFLHRSSVNLHSEILDTPEFFWEFAELEPIYLTTATYLNIRTRVEVLNKRLDVCREMLEMLNNELNQRHSSSLEWIVIGLILVEVFITIATEFLRYKFAAT
eukprot:tig00020723_g13472.t1